MLGTVLMILIGIGLLSWVMALGIDSLVGAIGEDTEEE